MVLCYIFPLSYILLTNQHYVMWPAGICGGKVVKELKPTAEMIARSGKSRKDLTNRNCRKLSQLRMSVER